MIRIKRVTNETEYYKVLGIRMEVFCKEQNVDFHKEVDGKEKEAIYYLLYKDGNPAGTCRYLKEKNYYLIGRLAILKDYRKQNLGSKLIQRVIKDILKQDKKTTIELHAQLDKVEFYKKNGFEPFGTTFIEANIDHIGMRYKK